MVADYRLAETDAGRAFGRLIDGWLASRDAGRTVPPIGLGSAVLTVRLGRAQEGMREVEEVVSVDQIDAAHRPAGGEFQRVLNAAAADAAVAEDAEVAGGGSGLEQDAGPGDGDGGHAAVAADFAVALRRSVLDARLSAMGCPRRGRGWWPRSLAHGWGGADLDAAIAVCRLRGGRGEPAHGAGRAPP